MLIKEIPPKEINSVVILGKVEESKLLRVTDRLYKSIISIPAQIFGKMRIYVQYKYLLQQEISIILVFLQSRILTMVPYELFDNEELHLAYQQLSISLRDTNFSKLHSSHQIIHLEQINIHTRLVLKKKKTRIKSRFGSLSSCSWVKGGSKLAFVSEQLAFFKAIWIITKLLPSLSHIKTFLCRDTAYSIIALDCRIGTIIKTNHICGLLIVPNSTMLQTGVSSREVQETTWVSTTEGKATRKAEELFNRKGSALLSLSW